MKRTLESRQTQFRLKPTQNKFAFQDFEKQLALPEAEHWHFAKKKVVIIDLDGTDILLEELLKSPELEKSLNEFRDKGCAVCLVTNKTILHDNGKEIESTKATLERLFEKYPTTLDLVLYDPNNSNSDLFDGAKTANKQAMLDSCVKAYSEEAAFCYIGANETILEYAATRHTMSALHIFMQKSGFPRVMLDKAIDLKTRKHANFAVALTEANLELSDDAKIAEQKRLRRLQAHSANSSVSASPARGHSSAVSRDPNYYPGKHSRGRDLRSTSRKDHQGSTTGYSVLTDPTADDLQDDQVLNSSTRVASRSPIEWLTHHLIKSPSFTEAPSTEGYTFKEALGVVKHYLYANLVLAPFKALFLIFPFDGYDPVTNSISYASGAKVPEPYIIQSFKDVSIKLLITTILGFPSRATKDPKTGKPTISIVQIAKNFVGGIDWDNETPRDKKRLQLVGILLKALVFLPVKIVLIPFKAILNGLKFLTEFLPWLATSLSYFIYQIPVLGSSKTWQWKNDLSKNGFNPLALGLMLLSIVLGLVSLPLFFLHVFCRTVMVAGRTLTSPLISLRKAFAVGSELKLPFKSEQTQRRLAIAIGLICAVVSVLITTISWAILWPLFVNHAIANMPTLMSLVNSILGSQPVVASLGALQGSITTVGAFLHTVFGGFITGLSNYVGVQITYTAIVAVTALPFALTFSALADYLSDRWANWHEGGIFKAQLVAAPPAPNDSSSNPILPLSSSAAQNSPLSKGRTAVGTAAATSTPSSKDSKSRDTSLARGLQLQQEARLLLDEAKSDLRRDTDRLVQEGRLSHAQATEAATQTGRQGRRALRGDDSSEKHQQTPPPTQSPTSTKTAVSAKPVPQAPRKKSGIQTVIPKKK